MRIIYNNLFTLRSKYKIRINVMALDLSKYTFSFGAHRRRDVIWIAFPYDRPLKVALQKALPALKWSQSNKSWYIADQPHFREQLSLPPKEYKGKEVVHKISQVNLQALEYLQQALRLKAYSESTIRTYSIEFAQLLYLLGDFPVSELQPAKVRDYMLYCIDELHLSVNQIHSRLNALKFYFEQVLHREQFFVEIPRPQKPSTLPKLLSTKEIQRLFDATGNPKHRLMLQLCYGMGLRVSEVVRLQIADIDSGRMLVHIRGAKGKKDRYVPLPASALPQMRAYYREYEPKEFLFEGQYGGQYSIRSMQSVFHTAMEKAKIRKKVGIHGLRHSYATHLLEYGTDMSFIQQLLGHNDAKTTAIYAKVTEAHLSKVESPLDRIRDSKTKN